MLLENSGPRQCAASPWPVHFLSSRRMEEEPLQQLLPLNAPGSADYDDSTTSLTLAVVENPSMCSHPLCQLLCLTLALLLSSVGLGVFAAQEGKTVTLTEKDKDREIQLNKGDKLVLKLQQLGSAGYTWSVIKNNDKVLKQLGEPATEKGKGLIGGAVTRIYRFEAVGAGKTHLEMDYKRPFEKDKAPAKVFKITVEVE